jgi:hypothetical protein
MRASDILDQKAGLGDPMLMVIFGAGASFDSSQNHPPKPLPPERAKTKIRFGDDYPEVYRPPLTNGLFERSEFEEFSSKISSLAGVLGQLRAMRLGSLEAEFQDLDSRAPQNPLRAKQLAAVRYYFQLLFSIIVHKWLRQIGGATNYKTLLERIRDYDQSSVCLVTFNYDLLLERALGWEVREMRDYLKDDWKLIKVHGSVDWARPITSPFIDCGGLQDWQCVDRICEMAPQLKFGEAQVTPVVSQYPEHLLESPIGRPDRPELPALFPAIAIPLPGKLGPECPNELREVLRQSLPQVSRLLIIGWAGREDHFLQLLREGLGPKVRGMVVSGSEASAQATIHHLESKKLWIRLEPSKRGFGDFVGSDELKRLYR